MAHDPLPTSLTQALATLPPGSLVVAFSGGMDSSVLLHALAHLPQARERGLRAVHVDHGLHAHSADWAHQCAQFAAAHGIGFEAIKIEVERKSGHGLEDSARRARRAALGDALRSGEILALAHHRDDQAETVLLKLLRGAGPEGLAGMRTLRAFAPGWLWRPLLDLPRAALESYARARDLRWIDDPSNADTHLRRNFLRTEILPRLAQRWSDADAALAHSATWLLRASDFIDTQAAQALTPLRGADPATLAWQRWLQLPEALRDPVLRLWLRDLALDAPTHLQVAELERQLRDAAHDRNPCVSFDNTELRRYRDLLYALRPCPPPAPCWQAQWTGATLALPCGGSLMLADAAGRAVSGQALAVRLRRGGEKLKPAGATYTRELRLLLQEAGLPPWQRTRVPLIFAGDELIAVGDLYLGEAARELCTRLGAQIVWRTVDSVAPLR